MSSLVNDQKERIHATGTGCKAELAGNLSANYGYQYDAFRSSDGDASCMAKMFESLDTSVVVAEAQNQSLLSAYQREQAGIRSALHSQASTRFGNDNAANEIGLKTALSGDDVQYLSQYYSIEADTLVGDASAYAAYLAAIETAQQKFNAEQCRLAGLLHDSVDTGVNMMADGTSSLQFQVCFASGTPIRLKGNTFISVEDAKPGMKVFVPNENDPEGEHVECEIVEVYHKPPAHVTRLTIESESSGKRMTIRGTENHRFYVTGFGWKRIADLAIGDRFMSENGDKTHVLIDKELEPDPVPVYNFQVRGCHTYFVGETAEDSVLVHNEEGCGGGADPLDELDSTLRRINNQRSLVVAPLKVPVAAVGGFENGGKAGAMEVAYKVSLPIAWALWKPEFATLGNARSEAWAASKLDGTWAQWGAQTSANVGVGAGYALILRGPFIRAVGNKTVSEGEMTTILSDKPGFLQMSAYDKGLYLLKEQGWGAIVPSGQGLALGTTTNYPVWSYHLPSVETVLYGVPAGSGTLYWTFTATTEIFYGKGDNNNENP